MITVSKKGTADFISIQDAINHAVSGDIIHIEPGIYNERVTIRTDNITLIGSNSSFREHLDTLGISKKEGQNTYCVDKECYSQASMRKEHFPVSDFTNAYIDSDKTIITGGLYGKMPSDDIGKLGTFRTYTMLVDAQNVTLENLTIENSAGAGSNIGQAIALYAEGEGFRCKNVRLLGWQDTLFTGPLPPKEIEKNGFIGPKQYSPRINGRQYYENCYIEGDIDFIFGSATAYFDNCMIFQKDRERYLQNLSKQKHYDKKQNLNVNSTTGSQSSASQMITPDKGTTDFIVTLDDAREIKSYATAPSTPEGQDYGYIFNNCCFLSDCPDSTCYLGRPWRNYASVVVMNSYLGPQIHKDGFHNWNKKDAEATVRFMEFENFGEGASSARAAFVSELSASDISYYNKEQVLPFL